MTPKMIMMDYKCIKFNINKIFYYMVRKVPITRWSPLSKFVE